MLNESSVPMAVSPAFSTWWPDSPFASVLAMAKTAEAARVLAGYMPVVPSVVWRFREDLNRWAGWMRVSGPAAISMDLGTLRSGRAWSWATSSIEHLGELVKDDAPRLLINGPSTLSRIADVMRAWPGAVTAMSQHPFQAARHGRRLNDDLSVSLAPAIDVEELAIRNCDVFHAAVRFAGSIEPRRAA